MRIPRWISPLVMLLSVQLVLACKAGVAGSPSETEETKIHGPDIPGDASDDLPATGGLPSETPGSGGATAGGEPTPSEGDGTPSAATPTIPPGPPASSNARSPIGWASLSAEGQNGTTGGAGGRTVTATTAAELVAMAASPEPLVIQISGVLSVPTMRVASNKTLVGMNPNATIQGRIQIRGQSTANRVKNVILQNLRIDGSTSADDGVQVHFAHHVWIDHCEVFDAPDGNLDIVHASDYVTLSWNKFRYSANPPDPDHRFSNLIGHSDNNAGEDTGRLRVTLHHNWFAEGIVERMPRVRFGDVHVFNNYYSSVGNNTAIAAGFESRLLIENNSFEGVKDPHHFKDGEPTAEIAESGNFYAGLSATTLRETGQGASFRPSYAYTLSRPDEVKALVMANAGPR